MNPGFWDAVEAERSGRHEVGIKAALAAAAAAAMAGEAGSGSCGISSAVGGGTALPRHRQGEVVLLVELQAGAAASVMTRFWSHVLKVRGDLGVVGWHRCEGRSTVSAVRAAVHSVLRLSGTAFGWVRLCMCE